MTFTVRPLPRNYCVSALCLHGTNLTSEWLTSEWLTRQSSSVELVFTLALRRKADILNTACRN